jgi:hypothetical protein
MLASMVLLEVFPMKRDTQKPSHDHASQTARTRKPLRLAVDKETLRNLHGGSRGPVVESPSWRPSQCPTLCF